MTKFVCEDVGQIFEVERHQKRGDTQLPFRPRVAGKEGLGQGFGWETWAAANVEDIRGGFRPVSELDTQVLPFDNRHDLLGGTDHAICHLLRHIVAPEALSIHSEVDDPVGWLQAVDRVAKFVHLSLPCFV